MFLVEAYVTNSSLNINHPFTYYSDIFIENYKRIRVKFKNNDNVALVCNCLETKNTLQEEGLLRGYKLEKVLEIIDEKPIIDDNLFKLASWLAKTTISPLITCLNLMLPKTYKTIKNIKEIKYLDYIRIKESSNKLTKKQEEILNLLKDDILLSEARKYSTNIVNNLISKGYLEVYKKEATYQNQIISTTSFKKLTLDQEKVYHDFLNNEKLVSLLFGVTGSGKTEVYLHLARYYLNLDKEVLILVPEISLTPQMIERVKQRFSDVIFYHSGLSDQERFEQYQRVKRKEVKIVVGTRSAIFLPFHNLGLIIIDEEHDSSYSQDKVPTYQVKNVAIKRALDFKAKVLLASATPSLQAYSHALKGDYGFLSLEKRINLTLPEIEIVDLNQQIKQKDSYILTKPLKEELDQTLNKNKQAIILLNRRGYNPIVKCSECNGTLMCQDCDSPLNYHKDENVLKCHICGRTYKIDQECPNCHSHKLIYYGFGTKKVEEELNKLYPKAHIARLDKDSTSKKHAHELILKSFEKQEIDILIGTQMIAKGLDYPNVTLVGILNGDAGLLHQDYNSCKMTFDLLMQASGRAGRANEKGKVIIQVFNPDHYAIKAVLKQDYRYFYNIEMNYRKLSNYPPYAHLLEFIVSDLNEKHLEEAIQYLDKQLDELNLKKYKPCSINKIAKLYRSRILIISPDILYLLKQSHIIVDEYYKKYSSSLKVNIDPLYLE